MQLSNRYIDDCLYSCAPSQDVWTAMQSITGMSHIKAQPHADTSGSRDISNTHRRETIEITMEVGTFCRRAFSFPAALLIRGAYRSSWLEWNTGSQLALSPAQYFPACAPYSHIGTVERAAQEVRDQTPICFAYDHIVLILPKTVVMELALEL